MKRVKRILAVAAASIMLCGFAITSGATVHEHALSYMGVQCYDTTVGYSHPYYSGGKLKSCPITVLHYRDEWKCACGLTEYRNFHTSERHGAACGQ